MPDPAREAAVLALFLRRLKEVEGVAASIVGYPETDAGLKIGSRPVDAIIDRNGTRWGVDHTSVDFLTDERSNRPKFDTVIVPLQADLAAAFPDDRLHVSVPFGSIPKGDWKALRRQLVEEAKAHIPTQRYEKIGLLGTTTVLAGIPVRIAKSRPAHGRAGHCFVDQIITPEQAGYADFTGNLRRAIADKAAQLAPYQQGLGNTALVLDTEHLDVEVIASRLESDARFRADVAASGITEIYACNINADWGAEWICPVKRGSLVHPALPDYEVWWNRNYELIYGKDE